MSTRGLCWCGLNKESHDGREMDAEGRMHRFNEPVHDPGEQRIGAVLWPDPPSVESTLNVLDIRKIK